MARPKRTFQANVGQPSVGSAGPDQIEYDLDNLFAMFDPNETLRDGQTQGGIRKENIADAGLSNGIATLDANGKVVQRLSYEGAANGVATLDTNARVAQDVAYSSGVSGFTHASVKAALDALAKAEHATESVSAFRAYQNAAQSLSANTWTKVSFQTEEFDHLGEYDVSNYRFIAQKSGLYLVIAQVYFGNQVDGNKVALKLYKNGFDAGYIWESATGAASSSTAARGERMIKLMAGDYIEIFAWTFNAMNTTAGALMTYFEGARIA